MQGKIIKGISGFYYVYTAEHGTVYECHAKGIFRKKQIKPLIGDDVEIEVIDESTETGNITDIMPRRNTLLRPAVANVDQAVIIFAVRYPDPSFNLLDRFLIRMEREKLPCIICFNKEDIAERSQLDDLKKAYGTCGYKVIFLSARSGDGFEELREILAGRTSTVAGPSGVGKSSVINRLCPEANMETGEISRKIERGKNTTRHSEIFALGENTYIIDTPGFTSLDINDITKDELVSYYPEFAEFSDSCRFRGCAHMSEPDCAVKAAVQEGRISTVRYDNYRELYELLKNVRRYR
jgi:ribosome biogenesis GTPase